MKKNSQLKLLILAGVLIIASIVYKIIPHETVPSNTHQHQKLSAQPSSLPPLESLQVRGSVSGQKILPREQTEALIKQAMKDDDMCKLMDALQTAGGDSSGDIDFLLPYAFEDKLDYELVRAIRRGDIEKLKKTMKEPYRHYTPFLIGLCMAGLISDGARVGCGEFQNKTTAELKEADAILNHSNQSQKTVWMTQLFQALIRTKLNVPKNEINDLIKHAFYQEGTETEFECFVGSIAAEMGKSITADYAKSTFKTVMFFPNFKPVYDYLREGMETWDRELVSLIAEKSNKLLHSYLSDTPPVCCSITAVYFYGLLEKAIDQAHLPKLAFPLSKRDLLDRTNTIEAHIVNDSGSTIDFLESVIEMNEKTKETKKCEPSQITKIWNEIKENFDNPIRRNALSEGKEYLRK